MAIDKKQFEEKAKEIVKGRVESLNGFKLDTLNIKMYDEDEQECAKVTLLFKKEE